MLSLVPKATQITLKTMGKAITHTIQSPVQKQPSKRVYLWEGFLLGMLFPAHSVNHLWDFNKLENETQV